MLNALKTLLLAILSQLPLFAAAFTWWQEASQHPTDTDLAERQQRYLELYWTYQLIDLREKGEMPVWEGIRLVRER